MACCERAACAATIGVASDVPPTVVVRYRDDPFARTPTWNPVVMAARADTSVAVRMPPETEEGTTPDW
ncbi:MAG: hypothetical protein JWM05_1192 [Acidimicrobiales bacterium]|nr:hypothetical protein [Acidimicrobiales bacterium]